MSEKKNSTTSPQSESLSTATESSDTTGFQTKASTTAAMPKTEIHTTTLPQTEIATGTNVRSTAAATQADTTSFSEISTKGPWTKATSTPMDMRPITAEEAATDKLPSSTDNELSTTYALKGNNNGAEIVLVHTSLLITSVAFALFSSLQV